MSPPAPGAHACRASCPGGRAALTTGSLGHVGLGRSPVPRWEEPRDPGRLRKQRPGSRAGRRGAGMREPSCGPGGAARAGYSRRSRPGTRRGTGRTAWPEPGASSRGCGRGWARTAAAGSGRRAAGGGRVSSWRPARTGGLAAGLCAKQEDAVGEARSPSPAGGPKRRQEGEESPRGRQSGRTAPSAGAPAAPAPPGRTEEHADATAPRRSATSLPQSRGPRLPSLRARTGNFISNPTLACFPSPATRDVEEDRLHGDPEGNTPQSSPAPPPRLPALDRLREPGLQAVEVLWRCCQDNGCAQVGDLLTGSAVRGLLVI